MKRRVMRKTQIPSSKVKVTLRGLRLTWSVSCPVHNSAIHEGILKELGINVYHNETTCHAQDRDP